MILRGYQREAVDSLYSWFSNNSGNPLLVLPTAAGKSLVQSTFIKEAIERYPSTRILMVSHVKELLEQNAAELLGIWPEAPVGIYSAGLGKREVGRQITVAGIQSVHKRALELGVFDLIMVDECHLIPPSGDGMYRQFMAQQHKINPFVKIIGMTATHYRLKSGLLHEGDDALFDGIAYEVSVRRLIDECFLSDLISKNGVVKTDLSGVATRGGEYVPGALADAMDKDELTRAAVAECVNLGKDRKSWLVFCSGVEHAFHVAEEIRSHGISCRTISGETPAPDRAQYIEEFKAGRLQAITNCDVLTTGFNARNVDMLVMLRPTKSTGLYVQMVGRAMRTCAGKENALILDFAGNIERHGPIDQIQVKKKRKPGESATEGAPVKECPKCQSLVPISVMECPDCGHKWEAKPVHEATASYMDVLAKRKPPVDARVTGVRYDLHSKPGSPDSVRVTYQVGLTTYKEWICFSHQGYARMKAVNWWLEHKPDGFTATPGSTQQFFEWIDGGMEPKRPTTIRLNVNGKYDEIIGRSFEPIKEAA